MICIRSVKKLFFKLTNFERARGLSLQLYASSTLQRNGNSDSDCGFSHFFAVSARLCFPFFLQFFASNSWATIKTLLLCTSRLPIDTTLNSFSNPYTCDTIICITSTTIGLSVLYPESWESEDMGIDPVSTAFTITTGI